MSDGPDWTPFRRRLLSEISPAVEHLAPHPTTAFVWPTETCSIGCAHCNFSSVPRRAGVADALVLEPARLLAWLQDAGARTVTLCGGGEPLDEPEFCRDVVRLAAQTPLNVGVYTSGASLLHPQQPDDYVRDWVRLRGDDPGGRFWVRLSFDLFHTRRLGTQVLADWVEAVQRWAPGWRLSLRGLRVVGDPTLHELAGLLGASLDERTSGGWLVLPSGRRIAVEQMAYIVDGRGSLDVLTRYGLTLPDADTAALEPVRRLVGRSHHLGRPLSRRLTVGPAHVDLEIHADGVVHVLEAQAVDARLSLDSCSWARLRDAYYRDPLLHAVAVGGLPLVATYLQEAIRDGVAPAHTNPFSVEHLEDRDVLDWVTAAAVVDLAPELRYPASVVEVARARLARSSIAS